MERGMRRAWRAVGGALGSVGRSLWSMAVLGTPGSFFPAGTFVVNVVGCVVFGMIAGAAEQRVQLAPDLRLFLLVGVLGGFTTFSSYAFESVSLIRDGQFVWASINVVGQVVAGLIGLAIGFALMR